MIVKFCLANWKSFRNPVTFSMIASKERQHGDRVPKLGKYRTRVLPIAAVYGGNASGKTNFVTALAFAQALVVDVTQPDSLIPIEPFRLDAEGAEQPSRFCFELLIDERIYEFSFVVTRRAVLEEKLVVITGSREKVLYHRRQGEPMHLDNALANKRFLQFAFQGTRSNQLFLTNTISQNVDHFRPVYDWFKDTLQLVEPDARYLPFERFIDEKHPLFSTMNALLPQLDTGIARLGGEEIPIESVPLPEPLKAELRKEVKESAKESVVVRLLNEYFVVTVDKDGELIAKKLVAYHSKSDGTEAKFEMHQESAGSRRVIDLLPALLELSARRAKKVYVIDEIDRSLHTLLTRGLLDAYLTHCAKDTRTQLLLTTHDVLLMDQQLLRRDEMWVAERDTDGASSLLSFSEYSDVRYDKDIRKSYLQGRLGGIPRILLGGALTHAASVDEGSG